MVQGYADLLAKLQDFSNGSVIAFLQMHWSWNLMLHGIVGNTLAGEFQCRVGFGWAYCSVSFVFVPISTVVMEGRRVKPKRARINANGGINGGTDLISIQKSLI
jgi:hypothetical protein